MFIWRATFLGLASLGLVAAQDQTIQVGSVVSAPGGVYQFIPPSINATMGSVITFNFSGVPGFHSVAQSTFSSPCQPTTGGFDSGFVEVGVTGPAPTMFPTWNLTITNGTQPIWFFCQQLAPQPHCLAGMVGGINVPGAGPNTFTAFQAAAAGSSGTPGQNIGGLVGIGASASAPPGPLTIPGVSGLGNPTAATAAGSAAASTGGSAAASAPTSPSAAGSAGTPMTTTSNGAMIIANGFVVFAAAFVGIVLA